MSINKSKLFDRRITDRYREKGMITKEQYDQYVKNLPDDAANAQYVQMDIHDAELTEGSSDSGSEDT